MLLRKVEGSGAGIVFEARPNSCCAETAAERYAELFHAARVLLTERVSKEDIVWPTLNFASRLTVPGRSLYRDVDVREAIDAVPILGDRPCAGTGCPLP
jgi:hypothetical protein